MHLKKKLETVLASSIRIDGSVDRVQIDKIYVMLKILKLSGETELLFLGIGEQTTRGSKGLFEAIKRAIIDNLGEDTYIMIMQHIAHTCCYKQNSE